MITYANLGGLGAREGIPVAHTWEPPPPPPPPPPWGFVAGMAALRVVLPLLLLLPLFLFRANRSPQAWWLWLPVGATALLGITLVCLMFDAEVSLQRAVCALAAGFGAVWLLAPWLTSTYRVGMLLKTLPLLAGFSLLGFGLTLLAGGRGWIEFWPSLAILLGSVSLAASLALTLTGFCVRRRFGRIRFLLWLAVWILLAWTAIMTPVFALGAGGSSPEWKQLCIAIPVISGLTMVLLLPLVLLAFFQPFYRTRFTAWLKLPQPNPAPGVEIPPRLADVALSPPKS